MFAKNFTRKVFLLLALVVCTVVQVSAEKQKHNNVHHTGKRIKYVFLFVGDGLGPLQRIASEKAYKAQNGKGILFNSLPVKGATNTLCHGGRVTDSAAAATSLACGVKTKYTVVGLDHNYKKVESVAELAKREGYKVGIISSVSLNHATPAGFYAHQPKRYLYDEISADMAKSNFDYFGGGQIMIKDKKKDHYKQFIDNGYTIIKSPKKMPELKPDQKYFVYSQMPFSIDRLKTHGLTLAQYTDMGIKHLYSGAGKDKGFFMMVEGGRIDWSGHANDCGGLIKEVKAFDAAVKVAFDFYEKHKDSTVIVVTGDHETGGLYPSPEGVKAGWTADRLRKQKHGYNHINWVLSKLKKEKADFTKVLDVLKDNFAVNDLSEKEISKLKEAWEIYTGVAKPKAQKAIRILYGSYNPVVLCMQHIFAKRCGFKWTTTGHSALTVPVTAIGKGSDIFSGYYENYQIARKLKSMINPTASK